MAKIAIITDSTAYLPEKYLKEYNITVLPQILIWGDQTFRDGIDIQPTEFYERLKNSKTNPSTSQVTPASFLDAYGQLSAQGYEILAILISSKFSGTIESAVQAKESFPDTRIEIFDSLTSAMALGFQALTAAHAIQEGAEMDQVLQILRDSRDLTGIVLTPETLEYLYRGGRIGGASRFLGTALKIKPILSVIDGKIEAIEQVRTQKKAYQRLIEIIAERAGEKPIKLASLQAANLEGAEELLSMANQQLNVTEGFTGDVSPVIGTHVGPGTVALCYQIEQ